MALFKILKGQEKNLPATKTEGWAYVTTDEGNMYVDVSASERVKIGAHADKADVATKAEGDTKSIREIYLAKLKQVTSDGTTFTIRGETGNGTNAPDLISIPLAGDKAGLISNAAQTIKGEKVFANGISFPMIATWPTPSTETYPIKSQGLSWVGSTDGAKIFYEVQASDKGMLVIEATDDLNAGATFRNSSGKEVSIINGLVTGAFKGNLSGTASYATSDTNGKNITSYVASVLAQSDNRTIRVTKGDGTTNDVKLYFAASSSFGGAANSANVLNINNTENIGVSCMQFFQKSGDATLMPDTGWWSLVRLQHGGYASTGYWTEMAYSFHSDVIKFRRNANGTKTTWSTIAFTDSTVSKATQAEKDWIGQVIDKTYMKYPLSISGEVITMTRGDGTSSTITVPDTKVSQSETTTSDYRPIILGYTNTTDTTKLSASTRNQVYASNKFYAQPSTGLLVATTFKGALDGNAKTATNAEYADKAQGDSTSIRSTYLKSIAKKSGSNYILRATKGDGTVNDIDLYFAASSSCGGPAYSANILNVLGSTTTNGPTINNYTKFATIDVSAGPYTENSILMFVSDRERNLFNGLIRIYFRTSKTITTTDISMCWLSISDAKFAGDMYAVKTADGIFDLYWYNRNTWTTLCFSVIKGGYLRITFVDNSSVSSITVAAQSSLGGQVSYAYSASSATNDDAGANIRSTYIASIKQVTSNGTTFTIRGYNGGGAEKNDLITIPNASETYAGLVTNEAQTLKGDKTLKGTLHIYGQNSSYREGIRIYPYANWSDILLVGSDTTSSSGTSPNSWFIGNNNGNFYITRNGLSSGPSYLRSINNLWSINTTTSLYDLNTKSFICDSWVRTRGNTGWFNEDYGGGWYMADSTYIRNFGGKKVLLSNELHVNESSYFNNYVYIKNNLRLFNSNGKTTASLSNATQGTASTTEGTPGTLGEVYFILGNSTALSSTLGAGADNARGVLRLYGCYTDSVDIFCENNKLFSNKDINVRDLCRLIGQSTTTVNTSAISYLMAGNSVSKTSSAAHSEGGIRLFGDLSHFTDIINTPGLDINRSVYLPRYGTSNYLVSTSSTAAVGGPTVPAYIDANGIAKPIVLYSGSSAAAYQLNMDTTSKYDTNTLQYYNTNTSTTSGVNSCMINPRADWFHHIRMNHRSGDGYSGYYVDLAWSFNENEAYMRRLHNGVDKGWYHIWIQGNSITSAVWNDYAECRESHDTKPGYVLCENGDDTLQKTSKRLQHFAGVSSDTWGFSQGETEKAKTPIAVAGRVLVYTWQDRNNYKPGDCVCAAPDGTVDIMNREEVMLYPDRIVGTVSCVPDYEEWGGGEGADRDPVKVNGRIWIKIK